VMAQPSQINKPFVGFSVRYAPGALISARHPRALGYLG
jgi:hypothetical protein